MLLAADGGCEAVPISMYSMDPSKKHELCAKKVHNRKKVTEM